MSCTQYSTFLTAVFLESDQSKIMIHPLMGKVTNNGLIAYGGEIGLEVVYRLGL